MSSGTFERRWLEAGRVRCEHVVLKGRVRGVSVMPPFDGNKNVICYLDDIYVYLKARADGAIARGRPPGRDEKPQSAKDFDKQCLAR